MKSTSSSAQPRLTRPGKSALKTATRSAYLEDVYTITANLAGLPGLSMPAGFVDGLPVGVQLLAPYFQEGRLLNVAHQYQLHTDWHTRSPAGF
jgi:aspartyl-tRNA(Asn)/glutamyl-tRNA(Gln) amidotransferase subunit A